MRRKNIYKSKLGTERATAQRYCQCSLPSRAERHYSGLNVARDMQLVATDDGNSRDEVGSDLGFVLPWGTYVVLSGYQLGARELLQNRNMKLIDCLIVSDAICHCDEAASLLHDRCEVRWCSESWWAGQGTRTSVLLFPR